ncbi:MAG: hypothetical protein WC147_04540 [Syntrophomonas sp.]
MILLLKIVSLTIWFIIMLFIMGSVLHRQKKPVKNLNPCLCHKAEDASRYHSQREKV